MNKERTVKDLIGKDKFKKAREAGLTPETILRIYHETGRNPKKLKEGLESFLGSDLKETLEEQEENLKSQLSTIDRLKDGVFRKMTENTKDES